MTAVAAEIPASTSGFLEHCKQQWSQDCHELVENEIVLQMALDMDNMPYQFCPPEDGRKPDTHDIFFMIDRWVSGRPQLLSSPREDTIEKAIAEFFVCP